MSLKYASLFTGYGGADIGAQAAGLELAWGLEIDPDLAAVANGNLGGHVCVQDILESAPPHFNNIDVLHASPPCTRASQANQSAEENEDGLRESALDMALAGKTIEFIESMLPRVFTLENVWGYRVFQSFAGGRWCEGILPALIRLGYNVKYWHLNSADYGGWVLCPIHDTNYQIGNANCAAGSCQSAIAPDIVRDLAMMRSEDQARFLALDAVAHLVKTIGRDIVVNAMRQRLDAPQAGSLVNKMASGKAGESSTRGDTSKCASTGNIKESIGSLLKKCLDAPLLQMRWSITSMETRQITLLKILGCLSTTENTRRITTRIDPSQMGGKSETNGDCPLCRYTAVPQTRKRLILVAARDFVPRRPPATHRQPGKVNGSQIDMFPLPAWVGWYEAIEDLIPTLPETKFAEWQLARLPELAQTMLVERVGARNLHEKAPQTRGADEPVWTVRASDRQAEMATAYLVSGENAKCEYGKGYRECAEPAGTISSSQKGRTRAFIMPGGGNTNFEEAHPGRGVRFEDEPATTVPAISKNGGAMPRAFLVDDQNSGDPDENGERGLTIRERDEPSHTVSATQTKRSVRAWLSHGRVVAMTPRCLARFQAFPDWYRLPENNRMACKGIGNAVPPLWYQAIIAAQLEMLS